MACKELVIQSDILKYLNGLLNCKAIKVMKANEEGNPDIFCCYRGTMVVLEVKDSASSALTARIKQKRQAMQMEQWKESGALVYCVWNLEMVKAIIGHTGTKI